MPLQHDGRPAIVVRERTWVPKELVADHAELRSDLTVFNTAARTAQARGYAYKGPEWYCLFEETEGHFIVPRAYKPRVHRSLVEGHDYTTMTIGHRPLGEFRSRDLVELGPHDVQPFDQRAGFASLVEPNVWPHGRVFVLRCGGGKTAIALKAAMHRGGRVLWVTVTEALLDQAKASIERFCALSPKSIGHVQASKMRWRGYGIAVATLQTLAMSQDIPDEFWNYWDLVIFDEGDVLAAPLFNTVVPRFRGERWVLTATPNRPDGLECLYQMHVGPVCYEHTEFDLVPDCYFITTGAPEKLGVMAGWDPLRHEQRFSYQLTASNLLTNDDRCDVIINQVQRARAKDRTVLVLGDNVAGLAYLQARAISQGIEDVSLVVGRTKKRDRDAGINAAGTVIGTTSLFKRGIDRISFDTLIIASMVAVNDTIWRQGVGRILRWNPAQPDKKPIVVVLVDENLAPLRGMAGKMAALFRKFVWPLHGCADKLLDERRRHR